MTCLHKYSWTIDTKTVQSAEVKDRGKVPKGIWYLALPRHWQLYGGQNGSFYSLTRCKNEVVLFCLTAPQ